MKDGREIFIFAGTTEGRRLSEILNKAGISHTVFVATEYGELMMEESSIVNVEMGRLNENEMEKLFSSTIIPPLVIDATHPFASQVTENIRAACSASGAEYLRVKREGISIGGDIEGGENKILIHYFDHADDCAEALKRMHGNILLTTGSKDLSLFTRFTELSGRIYARVLPSEESIRLCAESGLEGRYVIAMHGPFSKEMNKAIIRQYDINVLVTKESGIAGGFPEKIDACIETGTDVFIIGRPKGDEGISVEEAAEKILGKAQAKHEGNISLIGIGPGSDKLLTAEAAEAIRAADIIFGAERMLNAVNKIVESSGEKKKYPYYLSRDVVPIILRERPERVAILFSGDSGFFSGAKKMKEALGSSLDESEIEYGIDVLAGISSLSYFAAKLGVDYSDAMMTSIHGYSDETEIQNKILDGLMRYGRVFTLLSGSEDIPRIKKIIYGSGMLGVKLYIGRNLSYHDEDIFRIDGDEPDYTDGSFVAYIELPEDSKRKTKRKIFPILGDDDFDRGKVPMTKEAVRHLSIAKLELTENSVFYDIGSGTGSIAIQAATLSDSISVYAVEKNEEAVDLIEKNVRKHGLTNVRVINGEASSVLQELIEIEASIPTHAFIGGSGGKLREILTILENANPQMRVVINAVSLETISEIASVVNDFSVRNLSIEQIQSSRAKELGAYHLLMAENPVMICSFDFQGMPEEPSEA